jgi:hypothetical protein
MTTSTGIDNPSLSTSWVYVRISTYGVQVPSTSVSRLTGTMSDAFEKMIKGAFGPSSLSPACLVGVCLWQTSAEPSSVFEELFAAIESIQDSNVVRRNTLFTDKYPTCNSQTETKA